MEGKQIDQQLQEQLQLNDNEDSVGNNQDVQNDQQRYMTQLQKKQEKDEVQKDFKEIRQQFQSEYDKSELWFFYEYSQFEKEIVIHLLKNYKKQFIRKFKQELLKEPKKGYAKMYMIIDEYCQQQGIEDWEEYKFQREEQKQNQGQQLIQEEEKKIEDEYNDDDEDNQQQQQQQQQEYSGELQQQKDLEEGIIMHLNDSFIIHILEYLDSFSLGQFQKTCNRFKDLGRKNYLYKKRCLLLHKQGESTLPEITPLLKYREYVVTHPYEFPPEFRNTVAQDVRKVFWDETNPNQYVTNAGYFKQFKGWYSMFINAPKVNFGGVYRIKERYIKMGEIEFNHHFAPILEMTYYRYVRFFPDGSIRYKVVTNKLNKQQMLNCMLQSKDSDFDHQNNVYIGEYKLCKDKLVFKYGVNGAIFETYLTIQHSENKPNEILMVDMQKERNPDVGYANTLYQYGPRVSEKFYKYIPMKEIRDDIEDNVIAAICF